MKVQTVLGKEPGQSVPVELLELIMATKPTAFGFAVQCKDAEGNPELSVTREDTNLKTLMDDLAEFQKNAVDHRALICFGGPDKFHPEDILPLVLKDGNDQPFMALGIEGDFPQYSEPSSGRTDESNLASKVIIPTLLEICELTDGDLAKIISALGRDKFNNDFLAQIGHRGVMTILPVEGDFIHYGKNELGDSFGWGFTSQLHKFGDPVQEPEPVKVEAPAAKKFSFGPKKTVDATSAIKSTFTYSSLPKDVATAGTAPRASVPAVTSTKGATDVSDKTSTGKVVAFPSWLHKNEDIKSFYEMVYGERPSNWKKKIPVVVPEATIVPKNLGELHAWAADRAKARISAAGVKATAPAATSTAATAPKSGGEIAAQRQDDDLPIIPAKDMEKLLDFVAKNTDAKTTTMMKPSEIQALEKKWGVFSASIASTPLEMYHWPMSVWFALAKTEPRALVLAMREYANLWYNKLEAKDLVGTSTTTVTAGATTTVTKSGEGTVKTESVSNEAAPAPKRGWFTKKAAA